MLGQASALFARNQVSVYPPRFKQAGLLFSIDLIKVLLFKQAQLALLILNLLYPAFSFRASIGVSFSTHTPPIDTVCFICKHPNLEPKPLYPQRCF